jgi:hypothetical protein
MKYIGDFGRQDSQFDDTLALNAEFVLTPHAARISYVTLAACVLLPGGLFVLATLLIRNHLKEKHLGSH